MLATQGWQKLVDEGDDLKAVDRLVSQFSIPLQAAGTLIEEVHSEFQNVLEYATQYISLSVLPYRATWWRIFSAPCASDWANFLILIELLFSLPSSNGKVERVFSQVNVIKIGRRTQLSNDRLNDLTMVASNNVPLQDFRPDDAIILWWREKVQRPNQSQCKAYKKRRVDVIDLDSDSDEEKSLLDNWDELLESESSEEESSTDQTSD